MPMPASPDNVRPPLAATATGPLIRSAHGPPAASGGRHRASDSEVTDELSATVVITAETLSHGRHAATETAPWARPPQPPPRPAATDAGPAAPVRGSDPPNPRKPSWRSALAGRLPNVALRRQAAADS